MNLSKGSNKIKLVLLISLIGFVLINIKGWVMMLPWDDEDFIFFLKCLIFALLVTLELISLISFLALIGEDACVEEFWIRYFSIIGWIIYGTYHLWKWTMKLADDYLSEPQED